MTCSLPYKSSCFGNLAKWRRRNLQTGVNEPWNFENDDFVIQTYYNTRNYDPIAYFVNPFSGQTTRYCEEEGGYGLIDPVTIPEVFSPGDCFVPTLSDVLFQSYDYKCVCANGYMLSNDGTECLPCSEIHEHCT